MHESWSWWDVPVFLMLRGRGRQMFVPHWPVSAAKLMSSMFSENSGTKKLDGK